MGDTWIDWKRRRVPNMRIGRDTFPAQQPQTKSSAAQQPQTNSSTAQHEDMYRPLVGDDMRLIRIHAAAWDDPLTCDLRHWEAHERPEYYALSYTWGDMIDLVPITLNGRTLMIGPQLYAALKQFRETMRTAAQDAFITETHADSWLWTDSLCLNQTSDAEKQVQVPRMGEIYSRAKNVLGWLGELDMIDTADVELLVEICKVPLPDIYQPGLFQSPVYQDRLREAIGSRTVQLLRSMYAVLSRPFFSRVWIIQEMALAHHDPILVVGRYHFRVLPLGTVYMVARFAGDFAKLESLFGASHYHGAMFGNMRYFHHMQSAPDYAGGRRDAAAVAGRMNILLSLRSGEFYSDRAHDQLYGMLGFLSGFELPNTLRPDYAKPFEKVYADYTRVCLERATSLLLLDRKRRTLRDAPSWVPDYRHNFVPVQSETLHIIPNSNHRPSHRFLDERRLQVQGVALRDCVAVVQSVESTTGYGHGDDLTWCVTQLSKLRKCVQQVVRLTARPAEEVVGQILDIGFTPIEGLSQDAGPQDDIGQYLLGKGGEESPWGEEVWTALGVAIIIWGSWVATSGGIVGQLWRVDVAPCVGDLICAVQGFESPVLLRRVLGRVDDEYEFLGTVKEFKQGQLVKVKQDNKAYWEGKQLQQFNLV